MKNKIYIKVLQLLFCSLLLSGAEKASAQCQSSFTWNAGAGGVVFFNDLSSVAVGDSVMTYEWSFGDGTPVDFSSSPVHTYPSSGTYNVCLTISTFFGCVDSTCMQINVTSAQGLDITLFVLDSMSVYCNYPLTLPVYIFGYAPGYAPNDSVNLYINYGDGIDTSFYVPIPQGSFSWQGSHEFVNPGNYTPMLIVTGPDLATDSMQAFPIVFSASCGPVSGTVYHDVNGDCVSDPGDDALGGINVQLYSGTTFIAWTVTDSNGVYSFDVPPGNYEIVIQTGQNWYNGTYTILCPSSGTISVTSVPSSGNDFFLTCPSTFDYTGDIFAWGLIPGQNANVCISAYNKYHLCNPQSGTGYVILDPQLTALPDTGYTISGDTVIFQIDAGTPYTYLCIRASVDTLAQIGDTACISLILEPLAGDSVPADNTLERCFPIRTSYDPNDKTGFPAGDGPTSAILPGTDLNYYIRFQNTGTAPAMNVYILDSVDANLDITTFEVISASHPMTYQVQTGNVLRFNFNNINLPDSNDNEPMSHGFVSYRIKQKAGIADGAVINNTAGIYFDWNPVVVTNTTTHTVDFSLSVPVVSVTGNNNVIVYPNPSKDEFNVIASDGQPFTYTLYDLEGRIAGTGKSGTHGAKIMTDHLESGMYLLHVYGKDHESRLKIQLFK